MIFFEYILVGLLGSCALIFLAKVVMAHLLQREEGYYSDNYDPCDGGGESDD